MRDRLKKGRERAEERQGTSGGSEPGLYGGKRDRQSSTAESTFKDKKSSEI